MEYFEDYYALLQVHQLAEPAIIEAAYKRLARKYHPDVNKHDGAPEMMKKLNLARDTLCNVHDRKDYDKLWSQHNGNSRKHAGSPLSEEPDPGLVVLPKYIRFKDLGYGDVKTTYFDIKTSGGPYTHYSISRDSLPPWLEITGVESLSNTLLPVRVHIKATGPYKGTQYDCHIPVKLENIRTGFSQEIHVRVEMLMKSPILKVENSTIVFDVIPNTLPLPRTIILRNSGMCRIDGNLCPRQKWIKVSPKSFSFMEKQEVQIQIDAARLYNDLTGYIDLKTNCGDHAITVRAHVARDCTPAKNRRSATDLKPSSDLHICPDCKNRSVRLADDRHRYECTTCNRCWPVSELAYS